MKTKTTVKERLIKYLQKELVRLSNTELDKVKELIDSFVEKGGIHNVTL